MLSTSNTLLRLSAGAVLASGAAWAGALYAAPPADHGPNVAALRALAARLPALRDVADNGTVDITESPGPQVPAAVVGARPDVRSAALSPVRAAGLPALPPVGPVPAVAAAPARRTAPSPADDPAKSIALMGLTHDGERDRAWLVDLTNQDRESAAVGGSALGFTVREIGAESVVIARGSRTFTLRLGEKQIPTAVVETAALGGNDDDPDAGGFDPFGGGRGRGGQRGGPGGGQWAGRFAGPGGADVGGGAAAFVFGGDAGGFGPPGGFGGARGGGNAGGGFGGGGFGGFGGGIANGGTAMTSQFASGSNGSTSNPQTARRRGTTVTGDDESAVTPKALVNPQTERRLGTTTGPAFGEATGTTQNRFGTTGTTGRTTGMGGSSTSGQGTGSTTR